MKAKRGFLLGVLALLIAGIFAAMVSRDFRGGIVGLFMDVTGLWVAELELIHRLEVQERPEAEPTRLRISGLVFNSILTVRRITTRTDGSTIIVLVHLSTPGLSPGTRPDFEYELQVPDSVDEVRFGRNAKTIWTRGSSNPPLPK